ncbi:hypothetical protein HanIR_Chr10g0499381 [Helianthus annuus]|nr:hypothetical protein HanIR_Chr10g0499381 [Helianthus annuus]
MKATMRFVTRVDFKCFISISMTGCHKERTGNFLLCVSFLNLSYLYFSFCLFFHLQDYQFSSHNVPYITVFKTNTMLMQ